VPTAGRARTCRWRKGVPTSPIEGGGARAFVLSFSLDHARKAENRRREICSPGIGARRLLAADRLDEADTWLELSLALFDRYLTAFIVYSDIGFADGQRAEVIRQAMGKYALLPHVLRRRVVAQSNLEGLLRDLKSISGQAAANA